MIAPPLKSPVYSLPYVLVFVALLIMSLPVASRKGSLKKTTLLFDNARCFVAFFLLFVFVGLRGYLYTDFSAYARFYEEIPSLLDGGDAVGRYLENTFWEKGYVLFSILLKTISGNYFFYQGVFFLVDIAILLAIFKRYVPDQVALCFVFFFAFGGLSLEINFMRSAKAMMLFLISLKYVQQRRILPYFLLNILAIFFHTSALIYLPLYFVLNRRFSFSFYVLLFVVGNVLYLLRIKWVAPVVELFAGLSGYARLFVLAGSYLNADKWNAGYGISIGYLERVFTYILVLCFFKKLCKKSEANVIFINMLLLYVCAHLYLSEMRIFVDRIPLMFSGSYWFIYPQIYSLLKKDFKWLFVALFLLYGVAKFIYGSNNIMHLYDNALWLQYSYEERRSFVNAYHKEFFSVEMLEH